MERYLQNTNRAIEIPTTRDVMIADLLCKCIIFIRYGIGTFYFFERKME